MPDQPTLQFPAVPEPPEGPPAPRHSRGWRVALLSALAALVLVLPVGIYLALRGGSRTGPGAAAPSVPATSSPAPASPSVTPSTTAPHAPDGRIPLETLGNSTLTIPPWPTDNVRGPSGSVRFRSGVYKIPYSPSTDVHQPPTGMELVILGVTYGDVDRDGAAETVAEIGCFIQGGSTQLVAFDRTSSGRIVTLGPVVSTTGEIRAIRTGSTRVGADGIVTARVGDYLRCCGDDTPVMWQDRSYRWYGERFHQVGGPTRMSDNPHVTETAMSTGELVLGPVLDGYRYGTLTVTVQHRSGTHPRQVTIHFYPSTGLERAGTAWPPVDTATGRYGFEVTVTAPPVRGETTYTFAFRRPASISGGTLDLDVNATGMGEAIPWNNGATATIRTAG